MKTKLKYLAIIGVLSLALVACWEEEGGETEAESKTKVESSEKASQSEDESESSEMAKVEYDLSGKGFAGSYKFALPKDAYKDHTENGMFFMYDGYRVGVSDPYDDFDASTIEKFIESSNSFVLKDMESARRDIFPNNTFDEKPYLNLNAPASADIEGKNAYFVHGVVGNETHEKESYIVICYVMDEKEPYYVFGVSEPENPGPEDGLEDFLKVIVNTVEWNG